MTQEERLRLIESLVSRFGEREAGKLRLDFFGRCLIRLDDFCGDCPACQVFLDQATSLLVQAEQTPEGFAGRIRADYDQLRQEILSHLQKKHRLVEEGTFLGLYLSLGLMLGMSVGLMLGRVAMGMPVGMSLGIVIGAMIDAQAKKDGRVI